MAKDNLAETIEFFKKEQGFKRLLKSLTEKYRALGRVGGSVKLTNITLEEQESFSDFFRQEYFAKKSATVSFAQFEKALSKTKFAGIEIVDLLEGCLGGNILTKNEEREEYGKKKHSFFQELLKKYPHSNCQLWLENVINKGPGTRGIHSNYDQNPVALKQQLEYVLAALTQLPQEGYERLPLFAYRITQDPHAFDLDTDVGRFWLSALQWLRNSRAEEFEIRTNPSAEEVTELLQHFRLVRDDIQNFVTCAGLLAFRKETKKPVTMWEEAYRDKCVMNVPLREILRVDKFIPAGKNIVFIVENSGVFSALLDYLEENCTEEKGTNYLDFFPPLICTHGQFKLATLIMLDKLVESGAKLFYSGDFDPEGLQMAQRLVQRYPNQVSLWRYKIEDYERALSEVKLTEARLKKLASINLPALIPVKEKLLEVGKAGYQEELIERLGQDILLLQSG